MMPHNYKKKLIEVALPLDAINHAAGVENNIHTGLPANLHTWWSRKPLGIARAALFASLVDDPSGYSTSPEAEDIERLRLFDIIGRLSSFDTGTNKDVLAQARAEILRSNDGKMPEFWDPFCGGGSLPLEALRLGLKTNATDLNPVAVFITKILVELAPPHANRTAINPHDSKNKLINGSIPFEGLKRDVQYYGDRIASRLKERLEHLYPTVTLPSSLGGQQGNVIAWIWTRTVECPNPSCRAMAPLVNKFWLSTHKGNEAFAHPVYDAVTRKFNFEILKTGTPMEGTVNRSGATCLACHNPIAFDYIRSKGTDGQIAYQLMAIAVEGERVRHYLPPEDFQEEIASNCTPSVELYSELPSSALGFRVQKYGLVRHRDLFTKRQLTALSTIAEEIAAIREEISLDAEGNESYVDLIQSFLALSLSRVAQTNNSLVRWLVRASGTSKGTPAFDRQIVSMVWEFSEGNLLGSSVGSWTAALKNPLTALNCIPSGEMAGTATAKQADAAADRPPAEDLVVSTDPPYFDAIGYADLSDFFYIWLRLSMAGVHGDIFGTIMVPKAGDLTRNLGRNDVPRGEATSEFLTKLESAFHNIHAAASDTVPVTIYYAFKQNDTATSSDEDDGGAPASGWDTLLEGLMRAGFQITGTWPLRTESASRLRAIGSNALASSILLVCRKRKKSDAISRAEFIRELKRELPLALAELQSANIAPPDMPQSAIGPGMAIFSQYIAVLEKDDSRMTIKTALQLINRELDEYLSGIQGEFDSETRFAITWFEGYGYKEGDFGSADSLARARGISVDGVKHSGIVESSAGRVRIIPRDELDPKWSPETDSHLTIWECCQHLVRQHEMDGISKETAALLRKFGGDKAEAVKDLAYCLYDICANKRKDAKEATAYNALISDWTELTRAAASQSDIHGESQYKMEL